MESFQRNWGSGDQETSHEKLALENIRLLLPKYFLKTKIENGRLVDFSPLLPKGLAASIMKRSRASFNVRQQCAIARKNQ